MGLFDKKICDFCGAQIGLLGNRKLEDGNMCKECASKISPFMTDRRRTSVAEMKQHLQYREQNKAKLTSFRPTMTLGNSTKVYIDPNLRAFVVSRSTNYKDNNADVIPLSEVSGCEVIIDEDQDEIYTQGQNGQSVSYNPPRYTYSYEIKIQILLSNQWFSEINFDVSEEEVDDRTSALYQQYEQQAYAIKSALTGMNCQPMQNGMYAQQSYNQQNNFAQNTGYAQQGYNQQNNFAQNTGYAQQGYNQQQQFAQPMGYQQQPYGQQAGFNQQGFNQQGFNQQGFNQQGFNQQGFNQQGFNQQQQFAQPMGYQQQPYGQQAGFNQQQPFAQQTGFAQQGYNQQNNFAQQQNVQQTASGSWTCPSCGATNSGKFCASCGCQKPQNV